MAKPVFGKFLCSDWFFLGEDFAVWTVSMETNLSIFVLERSRQIQNLQPKQRRKDEYCHSSHFHQRKLKRLKFQRWMGKTNIFKCKPAEVHFTISNRVPYNEQLTNVACSRRTVKYWPLVVFMSTFFTPRL